MSQSIHVVGFAGSLRKQSFNRALLEEAITLLPKNMTLENVDLAPLPLFNADIEAEGVPESVHYFREHLAAGDAFLIASPEYNYSITGVLKNAFDWASRSYPNSPSPLNGKPLAIMGAGGGSGTLRSQMHLRDILLHNNMHPLNKSLLVADAWKQFDENLRLKDQKMRQRLQNLLEDLGDWTRQLQNL